MSATSDEAKNARRRELMQARAALTEDERAALDTAIAQHVMALPEYEAADLVLPYLSFGAEVDTRALIHDAWAKGKTVALPRCVEGTRLMRWYKVESLDGLVRSRFGVDEPAEDPDLEIDPTTGRFASATHDKPETAQVFHNALALVPGLEFDHLGFRLGYGGGFYDTFLAEFPGSSVGLCREQFLQDEPIAHDTHDLPANIVATNEQIIRP